MSRAASCPPSKLFFIFVVAAVNSQAAQATIDAISWGPEGMVIPNFAKQKPTAKLTHNDDDPISAVGFLKLAHKKGMKTTKISPMTLFVAQLLKMTDANRRRLAKK